jgi:hypothetical protein
MVLSLAVVVVVAAVIMEAVTIERVATAVERVQTVVEVRVGTVVEVQIITLLRKGTISTAETIMATIASKDIPVIVMAIAPLADFMVTIIIKIIMGIRMVGETGIIIEEEEEMVIVMGVVTTTVVVVVGIGKGRRHQNLTYLLLG